LAICSIDCSLKKIDKREKNFQKKIEYDYFAINWLLNALKVNNKKVGKNLSELWSNPTSV